MANLFDYLTWRGDLPLTLIPYNEVDAALFACLCYNDLGSLAASAEGVQLRQLAALADEHAGPVNDLARHRLELLRAMAASRRFGGCIIRRYVKETSEEENLQFSAITAELESGETVICYRGTDSTLVGWREDFDMSYETVPAQKAALRYLTQIASETTGPLHLTGHSKGGNLAFYAAAYGDGAVQQRIVAAYSFDGPGLDPVTIASQGYLRVEDRLRLLIPQSSVIGLLMGAHRQPEVLRSSAVGIMQHDLFTWQLTGPVFERMVETTFSSQLIDKALHDWLEQANSQQRHDFVDAVFCLLEASGASTTAEMKTNLIRNAPDIIQAGKAMDTDTRKMLLDLVGRFVKLTTSNAFDMALASRRNQLTQK